MPTLCYRLSPNFINLPRWGGQPMISAQLLAGKLLEAGRDSCLWVFVAPSMFLPGAWCLKRCLADVDNQANLRSGFTCGWRAGCFLPWWGRAERFDLQSPFIPGSQRGGTASFLLQSFCSCNPGTLQCLRGQSRLHHSSPPVCVNRIHLMPRDRAGWKSLPLWPIQRAGGWPPRLQGHPCVFRMQAAVSHDIPGDPCWDSVIDLRG